MTESEVSKDRSTQESFSEERMILVANFVPLPEDTIGADGVVWELSTQELLIEERRRILRAVWNYPTDERQRLLFEIVEHSSFEEAVITLQQSKTKNEISHLLEPNESLSQFSFRHPDNVPFSTTFVKGNLCISVRSFGKTNVDASAQALKIADRIISKPQTYKPDFQLQPSRYKLNLQDEVEINYWLPWSLGRDGCHKFFSTKGAIRFAENHIVFQALETGLATVEGFAIEPNRETYGGRLGLEIDLN